MCKNKINMNIMLKVDVVEVKDYNLDIWGFNSKGGVKSFY